MYHANNINIDKVDHRPIISPSPGVGNMNLRGCSECLIKVKLCERAGHCVKLRCFCVKQEDLGNIAEVRLENWV